MDEPSPAPRKKRGRGRPALVGSKPTLVMMNAVETDIARQMGDGVIAQGVRLALHAVKVMGIKKSLRAAKAYSHEAGAQGSVELESSSSYVGKVSKSPADRA